MTTGKALELIKEYFEKGTPGSRIVLRPDGIDKKILYCAMVVREDQDYGLDNYAVGLYFQKNELTHIGLLDFIEGDEDEEEFDFWEYDVWNPDNILDVTLSERLKEYECHTTSGDIDYISDYKGVGGTQAYSSTGYLHITEDTIVLKKQEAINMLEGLIKNKGVYVDLYGSGNNACDTHIDLTYIENTFHSTSSDVETPTHNTQTKQQEQEQNNNMDFFDFETQDLNEIMCYTMIGLAVKSGEKWYVANKSDVNKPLRCIGKNINMFKMNMPVMSFPTFEPKAGQVVCIDKCIVKILSVEGGSFDVINFTTRKKETILRSETMFGGFEEGVAAVFDFGGADLFGGEGIKGMDPMLMMMFMNSSNKTDNGMNGNFMQMMMMSKFMS